MRRKRNLKILTHHQKMRRRMILQRTTQASLRTNRRARAIRGSTVGTRTECIRTIRATSILGTRLMSRKVVIRGCLIALMRSFRTAILSRLLLTLPVR